MAEPIINVIAIPFDEVLAVLQSETLRSVEKAIASKVAMRVLDECEDHRVSSTQSDMSVSGSTVSEIELLLSTRHDQIIAFGIRFLRDQLAIGDVEEYPEGEEQEPSKTVEVHGMGTGFGVKYAIYYNFLANRSTAELRAYLKNRRIPQHAKFIKELHRAYEETEL